MTPISLANVYRCKDAVNVLYALLAEREPRVRISHKKMPTLAQHKAFIRRKPYKCWYLITGESGERLGSIYLTKSDEIGLFIFKKHRATGIGSRALRLLMRRNPKVRRFLANINPTNAPSIRFFKKFRFKHIQNTYELVSGSRR